LKKLFLLGFALLLLNPFIFSQWQTYNVTTNIRFYDVCVVNTNLIWACGDSAKVYRSTNSGADWQLVNAGLPVSSIFQVTAVDGNRAWVNLGMRIFTTSNGGSSWSEQFYSPVTFINKIHFFNQNTGYIIADQQDSVVGFFVTRNSGTNWVRSASSPVLGLISAMWINDNGVNAIDSNFIWFVAKGSPAVNSRFYKLSGGLNNSWQYYNIGISPGQASYSAFKNSNTGLVTSSNGIFMTTNGGVNWQIRDNTSFPDVTRELMIVPGTDWVIQSGINNIRISYDMCNSWQPRILYPNLNFCDAKDTNSIWVAASNGKLLKYNINYIGIQQISNHIPVSFILQQNYPNPFNPSTNIKFELPEAGLITFRIYDVTGREIYYISESHTGGFYSINYNAVNLSSGIYFYSAEFNGKREVKKMILLK